MRAAYMKCLAISGLLLALTMAAAGCTQTRPAPTVAPLTVPSLVPTSTGVPTPASEPTFTPAPEQTIGPTMTRPASAPDATPEATLPAPPVAGPTPVPTPTLAPTHTPQPSLVPTSTPDVSPEPTLSPTTATSPELTTTPTPALTPGPTDDQAPLPATELAGEIVSLNARILGLRFFESSVAGVPRDRRVYARSFPRSTTRFISWELSLAFPTPDRETALSINSAFIQNDESMFSQQSAEVAIQAGWTSLWHSVGSGWTDPGQWDVGLYRVELSIGNALAAKAWFRITDDAQVVVATDSVVALTGQLAQLAERLPWTTDGFSYAEQRAVGALSRILQEDQG